MESKDLARLKHMLDFISALKTILIIFEATSISLRNLEKT